MKKLSLQWRITLMTALLIGATCVFMNVLTGYSGRHYMDSIGSNITDYGDTDSAEPDFFDPEREKLDQDLTIIIHGAQESYITTNWYITAAVTLLGGVLAYFLSGHALKPLGFTAQRQFTGNAAHELRTPLSLMQAQLELFSAEHPEALPETADFLRLLREQTERMTQMTKTLLEMSALRTVPCTDRIELGPMAEEILADLAPLAERNGISLESTGDGVMTGSDTLIYRMLYNLTENAIRYNRPDGSVHITITEEGRRPVIRVADTGCGIPEQYRDSIFQPFFRVDKSRSREHGGVGLGLSLVWEIVALHGGEIRVEAGSEKGTTIAVRFPADAAKGSSD